MRRPLGVALLLAAGLPAGAVEWQSDLSALRLFDPFSTGWKYNGKLGLLGSATSTGNQETSYDTTISGATDTASVLSTVDLRAVYQDGPDSAEQTLSMRYGVMKAPDSSSYEENEDEIRFASIYRRLLVAPHFLYGSTGADTVFSGPHRDDPALIPDDWGNPFDPLTARVSGGYGQRYEQFIPDDFLEWRLGVRAQRRWGSQPLPGQDPNALGVEAYARYESTPKRLDKGLTWWAQYEGFAEFNDIAHVTNLLTASLAFNFTKYLQIQVSLRAYYESRPKEDQDAEEFPGYNRWSYKQDTLVGLTYIF